MAVSKIKSEKSLQDMTDQQRLACQDRGGGVTESYSEVAAS